MPKYRYQCDDCDHHFDKQLKISERKDPLQTPCEKCGGELSMVVGSPRIVAGVQVTDKRPDNWRGLLKDMHKKSGKTSTIDC